MSENSHQENQSYSFSNCTFQIEKKKFDELFAQFQKHIKRFQCINPNDLVKIQFNHLFISFSLRPVSVYVIPKITRSKKNKFEENQLHNTEIQTIFEIVPVV